MRWLSRMALRKGSYILSMPSACPVQAEGCQLLQAAPGMRGAAYCMLTFWEEGHEHCTLWHLGLTCS